MPSFLPSSFFARAKTGLYVAQGPKILPGWALAALCPALSAGLELLWVDAGNGFAAHHLARTARAAGTDPVQVLSRVKFARPFTAYQLEAMVLEKLPRALSGPARRPVIVSDLLALFCQPDLCPPEREAKRLFDKVLKGLEALPTLVLVLAVEDGYPGGAGYLSRLSARARAAIEFKGD